MKTSPYLLALLMLICATGCSPLRQAGKSYRSQQDAKSLNEFLALLPSEIDTAYLRRHLGEPIDMGFDYRYLSEEISAEGCAMGAVFHINEDGTVGDRWYGAICE